MKECVVITTSDNVKLYGNFVKIEHEVSPAVILLHMMPATKESWGDFQGVLAHAGFQSLAIDLRGHGESLMRGDQKLDYKKFSDKEHQEKIHDVEAAVGFFLDCGIPLSSMVLVGASIGANLALRYQAEHEEVKASVLLSPGLDYRGVKTEQCAHTVKEEQSVFIAGATDDMRASGNSCADMAQALFSALQSKNKKIKIFEGGEHGTDMFRAHPELMPDIIAWLRKICSNEL